MRHPACSAVVPAIWLVAGSSSAQDTPAQEAARRAMVLAQSPSDAAKVLFGREVTPTAAPVQAIGAYERGCLSGAAALPADRPSWQVAAPVANPLVTEAPPPSRGVWPRVPAAGPGCSSVTSF
jgi:hypothetical protein